MRRSALCLLVVFALSPASPLSAATFQNGSFEFGPAGPVNICGGCNNAPYIGTFTAGYTGITGWTITAGSVDILLAPGWPPSHGARAIDLDGSDPGAISQTFDTRPGATYRVSFDLAANFYAGPTVKSVLVTAPGVSQAFNFDSTGRSADNMGWQTKTIQFRATDTRSTLSFASQDPPGSSFGPALDNVVVTEVSGVLAQLASGGGWKTTITLVNPSSIQNVTRLAFWADDGSPLTLPFTVSQQGTSVAVTASSLERTLDAGATLLVETEASSSIPFVGWTGVQSSGSVIGFAIFRQRSPSGNDAEGTAPLESTNATNLILPYDNTKGFSTGVALVNPTTGPATISFALRDENGAQLGVQSIALPGNGHTSFAVASRFPLAAGRRGIIEIQNTTGGAMAALGLRFSPFGSFTSIPVTAW
ncbi:MAG: choice-of-anchor C family protein [Bryobacterales bacterium]|nr:choice-of-anchor C family protein [Bryobacterales bacterium]